MTWKYKTQRLLCYTRNSDASRKGSVAISAWISLREAFIVPSDLDQLTHTRDTDASSDSFVEREENDQGAPLS